MTKNKYEYIVKNNYTKKYIFGILLAIVMIIGIAFMFTTICIVNSDGYTFFDKDGNIQAEYIQRQSALSRPCTG